jgi:kinesin family member 6/9
MQELKQKYLEAKALGASATNLKAAMGATKQALEHRRMQRSAASICEGGDGDLSGLEGEDIQERNIREKLMEQKTEYKAVFEKLRERKSEIEHLQRLLEQSRQQLVVCPAF